MVVTFTNHRSAWRAWERGARSSATLDYNHWSPITNHGSLFL